MSKADTGEFLTGLFARYGAKTFLKLQDGEEISYGTFWADAEKMALRLGELGADPGDRVVVLLENSEKVLTLYLACALAGMAFCPLDPALPAARVAAAQRRVAPKLTITAETLEELTAEPAKMAALPELDADRDLAIIYSSGTTGEPKGIVHTLGTLIERALLCQALRAG